MFQGIPPEFPVCRCLGASAGGSRSHDSWTGGGGGGSQSGRSGCGWGSEEGPRDGVWWGSDGDSSLGGFASTELVSLRIQIT